MALAHIKILNITTKETKIVVDEKSEVKVKNNKYFFMVADYSQELKIEKNKIQIIRPEMTINLELNKIVTSVYKNEVQDLQMNFILNKLIRNNNDLYFYYSLLDKNKAIINSVDVSIKF